VFRRIAVSTPPSSRAPPLPFSGGSRFQIGGPTGAMVAILYVIVLQYGLNNLLLAGLVAGVMLILAETVEARTKAL
jgi:hypothetical protein